MHRGHAWVFRAESHDTMLAWYEDIKNLTEKTGEERNAFIRAHARSVSAGSNKALSISDDGVMDEDEADQVPYSATASQPDLSPVEQHVERPHPGGRFPSTITMDRNSQVVRQPSSPSSSEDHDIVAKSETLPGPPVPEKIPNVQAQPDRDTANTGTPGHAETHAQDTYIPPTQMQEYNDLSGNQAPFPVDYPGSEYNTNPVLAEGVSSDGPGMVSYGAQPPAQSHSEPLRKAFNPQPTRHDSNYGDWMAPAAGAGGLAFGAGSVAAYKHHQQRKEKEKEEEVNDRNDTGRTLPGEPIALEQDSTAAATQQESEPTGVEPAVYPTTTSTQPLPPNVAWATDGVSSVVEPSQIISSDGATPKAGEASNADPFVTHGLGSATDPTGPGLARDPGEPIKVLANRPALKSHDSIATISDLHVPGEYPRANAGIDTQTSTTGE